MDELIEQTPDGPQHLLDFAGQTKRLQELHSTIMSAIRVTLDTAIEAGQILTEIKSELKHGEFTGWVTENVPFDIRTAQRYMKAYRNRDELKNDSVSFLTEAYRATEKKKLPAPENKPATVSNTVVVELNDDEIDWDPDHSVRNKFGHLDTLRESIESIGQQTPGAGYFQDNGLFRIVLGHRRARAIKGLELKFCAYILEPKSEKENMMFQWHSNSQFADYTRSEVARAVEGLESHGVEDPMIPRIKRKYHL